MCVGPALHSNPLWSMEAGQRISDVHDNILLEVSIFGFGAIFAVVYWLMVKFKQEQLGNEDYEEDIGAQANGRPVGREAVRAAKKAAAKEEKKRAKAEARKNHEPRAAQQRRRKAEFERQQKRELKSESTHLKDRAVSEKGTGTNATHNERNGICDSEELMDLFAEQINSQKVSIFGELADKHGVSRSLVLQIVSRLEAEGRISGVFDRWQGGSFVSITIDEMYKLAAFVRQQGRVSMRELILEANQVLGLSEYSGPEEQQIHSSTTKKGGVEDNKQNCGTSGLATLEDTSTDGKERL